MASVIIFGILTGSLYALTGTGLVLVYRSSKVLNFALGGIGTLASYVVYSLYHVGLPNEAGIVIAVAVGFIAGVAAETFLVRPLGQASPIILGVSTIGGLLILQGIVEVFWGSGVKALQPLGGMSGVKILGVTVTGNYIATVVISLVVTGSVLLFIAKTSNGLAMRASSAGAVTATLLGVDVAASRRLSWAIGGACGALAAFLVLPLTYLSPSNFTAFTLVAFAAVVLGGFTSLAGVLIGSFVFGIGMNLLELYLSTALTNTFILIAVTAILLLRPRGLFGLQEQVVNEPSLPAAALETKTGRLKELAKSAKSAMSFQVVQVSKARHKANDKQDGLGIIAVFIAVAIAGFMGGYTLQFEIASALAVYIGIIGLRVVLSEVGQLSLGQGAFMAVGAYSSGILASKAGMPILATLPISVVAAALAGVFVGYLAVRLSGLYLALVTLLFAFAVPELIDRFAWLTGGTSGLAMLLPSVFASSLSKMVLCGVLAAIATFVFWLLNRGSTGLRWRAVRDSEKGSASIGIRNSRVRLWGFVFGASLAGLSGALSAMIVGYVSTNVFSIWLSIYLLIALVVGGMNSLAGCALGAAFIVLVPFYMGSSVSPDIVYGLLLVAIFFTSREGLIGLLSRLLRILWFSGKGLMSGIGEKGTSATGSSDFTALTGNDTEVFEGQKTRRSQDNVSYESPEFAGEMPSAQSRMPTTSANGSDPRENEELRLSKVSAGYGAGLVIRDISLSVRPGECVALVGPNGSGKSTLLRTISGLTYLKEGSVAWQNADLSGVHPKTRATMGIAHVPEGRGIFPELTVRENLKLGLFAMSRGKRRIFDSAVKHVLELFPELANLESRRAGTLSGGEQQMVAIGRALLTEPRLLLLDEPTLGLAPIVSSKITSVLKTVMDAGVGVLLVEQNLTAAFEVSDRLHLLVSGEIVGTYDRSSLHDDREEIIKEYLGSDVV